TSFSRDWSSDVCSSDLVGLLYQDLIRSAQLPSDGHLPPVLPIVLYNGSVRWHAAEELSALLQRGPRALEPYRANVRYVLIDQGRSEERRVGKEWRARRA